MPKRNVRKTARSNKMKTLKAGLVRKPTISVSKSSSVSSSSPIPRSKSKAKTRKIGVGRPKKKAGY